MRELKVENVILIWDPEADSKAFQTSLAVQEVNLFFTKNQKMQLFATHKKLRRKQPVDFLITEYIVVKNQTWVS